MEETHLFPTINDTLESMAQPNLLSKQNKRTGKYMLTTLKSLVTKSYTQMGPQDWRKIHVTFEMVHLPPQDDNSLAQRTRSVVYEKYMKDAHPREDLKHKYQVISFENQSLGFKAKVSQFERASLQRNLISSRREDQEADKNIEIVKQKDQRIKVLEDSLQTCLFQLTQYMLKRSYNFPRR